MTQDIPQNQKTTARIQAGCDPAVAHWQNALESTVAALEPDLVPGQLNTTDDLEPDEIDRFRRLHATLDLAPYITALFLPRRISGRIVPPPAIKSIQRVPEAGASSKILVSRHRDYRRLLVAETGPPPVRPGIDIFQDGHLLGSFDYETPEDCTGALSKAIWVHLRSRAKWSREDYINYTEGWFARSAASRIVDLPVNPNHSYIHHPVLLNIDPVAAIFKLLRATLERLFQDVHQAAAAANAAQAPSVGITPEGIRQGFPGQVEALHAFIVDQTLTLLKLLKGYDIVDFNGFTAREDAAFTDGFEKTVLKTIERLTGQLS